MSDDVVSTIHITEEAFNGAIFDATVQLLVNNADFKKWVEEAIREEVRTQAPGNPRIAAVIKQVQEGLDRYPALWDDQGMQQVVGKAIFDYMQKTL